MIIDPLAEAWTFDAIGTRWRIDTAEPIPDAVRAAISDRIERFDLDWSRFRGDSLVSRIANAPGRYRMPDDAPELLGLYGELYRASGGHVSLLVGRALESLGYDAHYSLTPAATRGAVPSWDDALTWDGEYLTTATPVLLDVGAAGKGYLVDIVSGVLSDHGIPEHVVDARGDLLTRGVPLRVALEHPLDATKAIGVVELSGGPEDAALCASASNRRAWGDGLHHVLDAVTGEPTSRVIASWAIASTARWADGARDRALLRNSPELLRAPQRGHHQNVRKRARRTLPVLHRRVVHMTAVNAWLDRVLGRVTMYALMLICGVALALVSLVFTIIGLLPFSPVALLCNAAVLLIFSYLANGLAGLVFRTRPQLSSTAITALLLLFIFPPRLDLGSLGGVALAAVVAVLAKYLLAWRGRHIFNPAAVGAFIVGLTGLTLSFWWIGTPVLLPFVAIAGFVILFRTRRFTIAVVFIVVATLNIVIRYAIAGVPIGTGIGFALLSSPIVFFACFMLDEPLTLPPRRWQQVTEAVVVGLLFQLGFSFGSFSSTPEFALVVGNLLAFFWGQRRGIRLDFVGRTQLTPTSWQFDFRPHAPVRFAAGQYMELSLPHGRTDARGWRRAFTIASAPGADLVRFAMRVPERSSSFKSAMLELQPGAVVTGTSVSGDFVLPKNVAKPLLLVAAGIGITPFISQLEQLTATGEKRDIVVLYWVLAADDIAFAEVLTAAGCPVVILSPTRPAELPNGWSWAGESEPSSEQIHKAVPDAVSRATYLSGPPELVAGLERALHQDGVKRIVTDVFIGY